MTWYLRDPSPHPPAVASSPELENHLQISEKAVAEFIIDMAKDKSNVDEFKKVEAG